MPQPAGRDDARAVLQQLDAASKTRYVPPYPIAVIHAARAERRSVRAWLEKAYEGRDSWMAYLAIDPRMDVLRQDPRFAAPLRRLKLES